MRERSRRLGVCSWSLQPGSPVELAQRVRAAGLDAVQLALNPLVPGTPGGWDAAETARVLADAGIEVLSGMASMRGEDYTTLESIERTGGVRPDEHWAANLATTAAVARVAADLGLGLVTYHAGFMPDRADDPERAKLIQRIRELSDLFSAHEVEVALETGQETAANLLSVLDELARPDLGVNFDPANMLLYGKGDPVEAITALGPHVRQIHIKDAHPSPAPGAWGSEMVVGEGSVDWPRFLELARGLGVDLVIEREHGDQRVADVIRARDLVREHVPELA